MPTRKHLFKAKRKDNGGWVKGSLITYKDGDCFICVEELTDVLNKYEVDPETICECTGVPDKNGDEIFEGDIVKAFLNNETLMICSIIFRAGCFWYGNWNFVEFLDKFRNVEVISNIYDNPELLEVKV